MSGVAANAASLGIEDSSVTTVEQLRTYVRSYLETKASLPFKCYI